MVDMSGPSYIILALLQQGSLQQLQLAPMWWALRHVFFGCDSSSFGVCCAHCDFVLFLCLQTVGCVVLV